MPVIRKYQQRSLTDADIPAAIARDTEITAAIVEHEAKNFPHRPLGIEFAFASANYLDFHTGLTDRDFDGRIIVNGGGASNGLAEALFQFLKVTFASSVAIGLSGSPMQRILSASQTLDPPVIVAGAVWTTTVAITGAVIGDYCKISITTSPSAFFNFPFQIDAVVTSASIVTIYLRNLGSTSVDLAAFGIRIIVIGFS